VLSRARVQIPASPPKQRAPGIRRGRVVLANPGFIPWNTAPDAAAEPGIKLPE